MSFLPHILDLIDFGKATTLSEAKKYYLNLNEQAEYTRKYPHIAPEVISGESRQSVLSDIFSVGGIFYKLIEAGKFESSRINTAMKKFAGTCRLVEYRRRPKAKEALTSLQNLAATCIST